MPYKLSPSKLSLLRECPKCFWLLHNKGIECPGGIFPSLPSGMDSILKKYFDSYRQNKQVPPEIKETGAVLFNNLQLLNDWRNPRKGLFWVDDKNNMLTGAVDDILQKGIKLIVLDFKTRGWPCKDDTHEYYQDQMDIYNFLLRENGYDTEDYAYLLFYHPTHVAENSHIKFETTLKKIKINTSNAEKIFNTALKILEGPEPQPGENCRVCGFVGKRK